MTRDNRPHVLVVDDEADLRELLADALSAEGLRVVSAASGQDALELARREQPDFLITDLCLGDCTGLDVIDGLRREGREIPAVVITGRGDGAALSEASTRHPVELMTKPLDLPRLGRTIHAELARRAESHRTRERTRRLRRLARGVNIERKQARHQFESTCSDLSTACRNLSGQVELQKEVIAYQGELVGARNDDDVFRALFRMFTRHSGPLFGVAMVCDSNAALQIVGRFGVPYPDNLRFCETLGKPIIDSLLAQPQCLILDAGDHAEMFDASIRRKLVGLTILAVPLVPAEGELIGVVLLYRKGEQPFLDTDITLAELVAEPTALAVRRND